MQANIQQQDRSSMPVWEHFVPSYVNLYYVDYDSNLDGLGDVMNECLRQNSLCPIYERIDDWWEYPEGYEMEEISKDMERAGFGYVYEECEDEIRDWLYDHDESTPVEDLLGNTRNQVYFYDLGVEIDGWHSAIFCNNWRGDSEAQAAYKIRRKLGIKKGTKQAEQVMSIVQNSSSGHLRIYFDASLEDLIKTDGDFKSIVFKGKFNVANYDPVEGEGDFETIELDCAFEFNRENLFLSDKSVDRHPLEDCFGMCSDWCSSYADSPKFSMEPAKKKCKTSSTNELAQTEMQYIKVFKNGGCTRGDTNINRHRGVRYINEFPCRLECPCCGQEWID